MGTKAAYKMTTKERLLISDPTDRLILWLISHDSLALGVLFLKSVMREETEIDTLIDFKVNKALSILLILKEKNLIRIGQEKWIITWKGQLYRFVTNKFFPLIAVLFAAIVSYSVFILNHTLSSKEEGKSNIKTPIDPIYDSSQLHPLQIDSSKVQDSAASPIHKTKTSKGKL